MSDETPPPSLRLRPRVRTDEAASNPASAPATATQTPPAPPFPPSALIGETPAAPTLPPQPATAGPDAAPRFRLKPKISADPDATTGKTMMASMAESIPPPEPIKPLSADIPVDPDVPRLKLKSLVVDASAPGAAAPSIPPSALIGGLPSAITPSTLIGGVAFPPPPPVSGGSPALPPGSMLPLPPQISPETLIGALPPVVVSRAEGTSIPSHSPLPSPGVAAPRPNVPPPPVVPPVPTKAKLKVAPVPWYKTIPLLISIVVLLVGAGGWTAYFLLSDSSPSASDPTHRKPGDGKSLGNVTPPVVADPQADNPANRIAPLPPQPDAPRGIPVPLKNAGPVVNNSAAALALRSWTENARVTGVLSGDSPRAIINGRLVRPGDMIDAAEGISFDGIDIERKVLIFRNRTGLFSSKPF